jgi:hypothetical protein
MVGKITISILSFTVFILFTNLIITQSELSAFKSSKKELSVLLLKEKDKALNYQLIALLLSNLCDETQSSRNRKNNSKEYFELLKKVE